MVGGLSATSVTRGGGVTLHPCCEGALGFTPGCEGNPRAAPLQTGRMARRESYCAPSSAPRRLGVCVYLRGNFSQVLLINSIVR